MMQKAIAVFTNSASANAAAIESIMIIILKITIVTNNKANALIILTILSIASSLWYSVLSPMYRFNSVISSQIVSIFLSEESIA